VKAKKPARALSGESLLTFEALLHQMIVDLPAEPLTGQAALREGLWDVVGRTLNVLRAMPEQRRAFVLARLSPIGRNHVHEMLRDHPRPKKDPFLQTVQQILDDSTPARRAALMKKIAAMVAELARESAT